jgi:hypothetical protein
LSTPLPQPPPDLPAPLSPEKVLPSRSKLSWIAQVILACLLISAFAGLSNPVIHRSRKAADRTEAINNIKQIGMMLTEFDAEYGRFPDTSTIAAVKAATKTPLTLGSATSNDLFRQCLVGGGGRSEKPFWAKTAISPKKADDVFSTDSTALAKGECGFAYIAGLSASGDPATPVVMSSLLPGKLTFDLKALDGKAVILFTDNSAQALPIEKDGKVLINGMDIFDPRQAFWKGKAPDVKWPE